MSGYSIDVMCPCCEAKLTVDVKTGEVIWHEKKAKPVVSLSDMVKGLDAQKKAQEQLFRKQSETHKDRNRLLEEKFKESAKNVDKSGDKPIRDFDLD
ncbi:MAG: 2-nitropropane dioxygenase [Nitrospinae bacterium]|jgi:hypothetical protein|nr:2-nitropropane dioxygenase [Nitrospinota bacterium]MDA1110516.1 2-nitropropane dioxygenase [Nitrospinota bacterium]